LLALLLTKAREKCARVHYIIKIKDNQLEIPTKNSNAWINYLGGLTHDLRR